MRITLLRHGKPTFELKGYVRGRDLPDIAESYDRSGIVASPPDIALKAVNGVAFVTCSHLRRSVESVEALGFSKTDIGEQLFAETTIPHVDSGSIPLPISFWILLLRLMWLCGFSRNGESLADARRRAAQAATRLIEMAEMHGDVLLVGHGFINYFIAKELRRKGWQGPARPGRGYWGFGRYERVVT
jgi:broad specificity phosphatase PhoE